MTASVRQASQKDLAILGRIKACGIAVQDIDGAVTLPSGYTVSSYRLHRLLILKLLKPNEDGLFGWAETQSYAPTEPS